MEKSEKDIFNELKKYCDYYDIPFEHIVNVMSDLKVIPMLRGKGFEYTVSDVLKILLSEDKWKIENPNINAQSEVHDVDVHIKRKKDNKEIRVECKLAKKDSISLGENPHFQVKCMRSRTISDNEMATRMANRYGVSRESILAHADNYREGDFDFVITSMGNAFWTTEDNGSYIFKTDKEQIKEFSKLFPKSFSEKDSIQEFKKKAFNFMLFAKSSDIKISLNNKIICARRKCIQEGNSKNCGFIPNYPIINLKELSEGKGAWKQLEDIEKESNNFLK